MLHKLLIVSMLALAFSACGGGSGPGASEETPVTDGAVAGGSSTNAELEAVVYDDKGVLHVVTKIASAEDLAAYKAQKVAEAQNILDETKDKSTDRPYYPVVITMSKPTTLAEMRQLLSKYNPTVAKALKSAGPINYLPKATLVKNEDTLIVSSVKFSSTEGGGQLSYDTLSEEKEMSKLEKQIALKEKQLNGIAGYQLIKGITSVTGGIHRNALPQMQNDSKVFLADIGPKVMYQENPEAAVWNDLSKEVEKYSE